MVHFLTNKIIPNYLTDKSFYTYNNPSDTAHGRGVSLELLEVNYPYWILYNHGVDNISISTVCDNVKEEDVVIFYNCTNNISKHKLDFTKPYKKIQIVTDRPAIKGCDGYICYDPSIVERDLSRDWYHVLYPMPIGLKKCKPSWPPVNITCISPDNVTVDPIIVKSDKYNIISDSYVNNGDEDVLFHIRKKLTFNECHGIQSRLKFPSHKTANRLYQSWTCNAPGIFSSNTAMEYIRESEYDYMIADTYDELNECVEQLCKDKDLFVNMIKNCYMRENENNFLKIVNQWLAVLNIYDTDNNTSNMEKFKSSE